MIFIFLLIFNNKFINLFFFKGKINFLLNKELKFLIIFLKIFFFFEFLLKNYKYLKNKKIDIFI
jgi:hypothetical protein